MFFFLKIGVPIVVSICAAALFNVTDAGAAMDPRFELDPQTLGGPKRVVKPRQEIEKRHSRVRVKQPSSVSVRQGDYVVKPGDNLFKILIRDYGLSNDEAESFIEEIKRENNIYDIKRLKVGQKIIIPTVRRSTDGSLKLLNTVSTNNVTAPVLGTVVKQSFKLESAVPALSEQETVARLHDMWKRIIPSDKEMAKPLALQTSVFSLSLDPQRYPVFSRLDGGRIVLDQDGSIPPLVKSLIEDKDASIRIVSVPSSGNKRFMASLLDAAGFYSVEENFTMEFGTDPKLTVQSDFKVEKTAESLIKHEVVLVNSGRKSLPPSLSEFLGKEGFSLYEPFASLKSFAQYDSRKINYISSKKQPEMIDDILSAFSVSPERDRYIDVFAVDNNGISLSVKAQRYFERSASRYIVTSFDGDPINYTLFRILETKGYKVVILDAQDDFRKISEKLISRMEIKGAFAQHDLLQDRSAGYSLQMSGFKLDNPMLPGGGIFLTDRPLDRIIKDLFTENGFSVESR